MTLEKFHYYLDNLDIFSKTKSSVEDGTPPMVGEINFRSSFGFTKAQLTVSIPCLRRVIIQNIKNRI